MKFNTVIIGAGISGLSTAFHLKKNYIILEKENSAGGLCRSVNIGGFTFDYTGHFLHIQSDYVRNLVLNLLKSNIKKIKRNSFIYSNSVFSRYPFQANLYGLPEKVITECINGLIETKFSNYQLLTIDYRLSFQDWVLHTFGKGFAKHFFIPYNKKLFGIDLFQLTADWVEKFIPKPDLREVLKGAFIDKSKLYGYNAYFFYPEKGGIQALIDRFRDKVKNLHLCTEVKRINLKEKYLVTNDGRIQFKNLVSTIPVVEFLSITDGLPSEIYQLRNKLNWRSVLCINLGIKVPNIMTGKHWIYFPEPKTIFYRIGFYHNFSKLSVPRNCSSMYIEIAHDKLQKPDINFVVRKVIEQLKECKIIDSDNKIVAINILPMRYAYIIYDKNRKRCLDRIQAYLLRNSVYSIGRFGGWKYSYIEESILDGKSTAELINAKT